MDTNNSLILCAIGLREMQLGLRSANEVTELPVGSRHSNWVTEMQMRLLEMQIGLRTMRIGLRKLKIAQRNEFLIDNAK